MKIIIAPFSAKLPSGNPNPKNYPVRFWTQVVAKLNSLGAEVIQVGVIGEPRIEGVSQLIHNWPLKKLRAIIEDADTFISVDTWLPHFIFGERLGKSGVVIFSQSDPNLFGHPENTNLLKDRKYLRELQFQDWNQVEYNEAAFVLPHVVVEAVLQKVGSHAVAAIA